MNITKLTSADGFVVKDLPEATVSVGVLRCARKLLQDGAVNLARTTTYSFAAFGSKISGASGAVNAEGETRDAAVAAATEELAAEVAAGTLVLRVGKGISPEDLATWASPFAPAGAADELAALAAGIVASTRSVLGSLDGATIAIENTGPVAASVADLLVAAGAAATVSSTAETLTATGDAVIVGSKPGLIDHEAAATLQARFIIPSGPMPVTARGLAVARRAGCEVVPDFVSIAGPLIELAAVVNGDAAPPDVAARIDEVLAAAANFPDGLYLGACFLAEEFLRTWVDALPFGRPLA